MPFFKYQGTGNDFIVVDNRSNTFTAIPEREINRICDRRFSIGADGFMLLNQTDGFDFEMKYYNADGTGNYKIVIEGIDSNGNLGRQVYRYKVQ